VANPKKQAQNEKSSRKHAQYAFSSKLKRQKCHKIWKKSNLQKTSPKNKQNSIETSPKTSNPQVLKKTATPLKNKPKFAGKTQGWQHCHLSNSWGLRLVRSCTTFYNAYVTSQKRRKPGSSQCSGVVRSWSWRFLGGVGFWATLGVGVGFFCPTPVVQLDHFFI